MRRERGGIVVTGEGTNFIDTTDFQNQRQCIHRNKHICNTAEYQNRIDENFHQTDNFVKRAGNRTQCLASIVRRKIKPKLPVGNRKDCIKGESFFCKRVVKGKIFCSFSCVLTLQITYVTINRENSFVFKLICIIVFVNFVRNRDIGFVGGIERTKIKAVFCNHHVEHSKENYKGDNENRKTGENGFLSSEFFTHFAGRNCCSRRANCKYRHQNGCLAGSKMENFSCKQSKERGDCVCAAEQEEKTHQHKCKALSFAAGKLFGFNRSFFFFSCLFFSGRFRLCVHFYVKVRRCF